jgi:hypothetical protein
MKYPSVLKAYNLYQLVGLKTKPVVKSLKSVIGNWPKNIILLRVLSLFANIRKHMSVANSPQWLLITNSISL